MFDEVSNACVALPLITSIPHLVTNFSGDTTRCLYERAPSFSVIQFTSLNRTRTAPSGTGCAMRGNVTNCWQLFAAPSSTTGRHPMCSKNRVTESGSGSSNFCSTTTSEISWWRCITTAGKSLSCFHFTFRFFSVVRFGILPWHHVL